MTESKTIRVAAVQTNSINGEIDRNLVHASPFVAQAKSKGAQLILLPELISTGYELTDSIWSAAEPSEGPTVQWLKEQALEHSVWIGTSFLEAVEDHFYNTFVLVNSDGQESMRVRKNKPGATEAFFFEGSHGSHVVDTPFGRIGVSICYEGYLASSVQSLHQENPDFVLMPMSAPTPTLNKPVTQTALEEYNAALKTGASNLAKELGIPTIMANKVGRWKTKTPWPFPTEDSTFPGFSSIAGADGEVISSLGNQEGIIVTDIVLNPEKKTKQLPEMFGKWARRPPKLFKLFIIAETLGRLKYLFSIKRRRMARMVSKAGINSAKM
jgi:N-carbamoylputrescine amidase